VRGRYFGYLEVICSFIAAGAIRLSMIRGTFVIKGEHFFV